MLTSTAKHARPFLKWAGGKGQLLDQFCPLLPRALTEGKVKKYCEPFLGGGAMFFYLSSLDCIESSFLYEINPSVALCYQVIQKHIDRLYNEIIELHHEYHASSASYQEELFYNCRKEFNDTAQAKSLAEKIRHAALLLFLNKTCFNGLYRVNSRGEFNVPFGRYKKPNIGNRHNLYAASAALKKAEIICGDFSECLSVADQRSLVYLDPPYRPISNTASFGSYSTQTFCDQEQHRLKHTYEQLDRKGAFVMLSNSDPKNINPADDFFDDLYRDYHIRRLQATRLINCNASRRGLISELLILNYTDIRGTS